MKLERISDNQIRCTLTRSDLADRELKLSELAYGTDKAKALFQEMMLQASDELGFEADNIPLIIEAVPLSNECIMLIVTKVEDPEELDTRFSKFSPVGEDMDDSDDDEESMMPGAEDILDIFKHLSNDIIAKTREQAARSETDSPAAETIEESGPEIQEIHNDEKIRMRIYAFPSLDAVSQLSTQIDTAFTCKNVLYKHPETGHYYLVITSSSSVDPTFDYVCRTASEFGRIEKASANTLYYYDEHYEKIIRENALQILHNL